MNLFVASDLHIYSNNDPLFSAFLNWIETTVNSGDYFILAGDIFDLWIEDKTVFLNEYNKFISLMEKKGKSGVLIYYIEGNHDFHLKNVFKHIQNFKTVKNEITLNLFDKKFYFAHGDLVDKKDIKYLSMRYVLRSFPLRALVRSIPDKVVNLIGTKSSQMSRNVRNTSSSKNRDEDKIKKTFRNFAVQKFLEQYDYVVLGHSHLIDELEFVIGDHRGQYLNMGYPKSDKFFLKWESERQKFVRVPY